MLPKRRVKPIQVEPSLYLCAISLMIKKQTKKLFNYFSRYLYFDAAIFFNFISLFLIYQHLVDVKSADPTTTLSPTVGMAALGGCGRQPQISIFNFIIFIVSQCLPFSIFYSFLLM